PVTAITNVKRVHRPTRLVVDRFHWLTTLFLFNDRRTTEIYTLSLHDALPISALKSYCWGSNLISKTFFSTRVHPFPVTRSIRPLALTLRCRFLAGWSNFAFDKRNTVFYSCVDETQDQETETEEHGKQLAYDR